MSTKLVKVIPVLESADIARDIAWYKEKTGFEISFLHETIFSLKRVAFAASYFQNHEAKFLLYLFDKYFVYIEENLQNKSTFSFCLIWCFINEIFVS